ncbi:TetR/AcrR family transcriptional regulator [Gracilibacillus sp. S3-1-1]|uniref:TetR/AcrR family transcriptional regulator n=1 Tax=Gracilibacillus pellucidus TaxID=3095368 RepID=A0ACC6M7D8_9BACI|nr:TetR/AcrR family transcriptional regulator [Gracilibacillus sp. S3-1-1]MDX8046808.1 TetR/AcrR family transcriptional regulator [Gracilibacillus sp. S3-1-1]
MDRKQLIMDAAAQSFSQFGYKATTMDQVSKIARVGKGTIYLYFSNKEELLQEIMNNVVHEMHVVALKTIEENQSFIDYFHEAVQGMLKFREQHELIIKLSQELKDFGTPVVYEVLQSLEEAICFFIEEKIAHAIKKKEIKDCDPKITAFLMFKMYINLVNDWKVRHQPLPKDQVAALINLYFIEGLAP